MRNFLKRLPATLVKLPSTLCTGLIFLNKHKPAAVLALLELLLVSEVAAQIHAWTVSGQSPGATGYCFQDDAEQLAFSLYDLTGKNEGANNLNEILTYLVKNAICSFKGINAEGVITMTVSGIIQCLQKGVNSGLLFCQKANPEDCSLAVAAADFETMCSEKVASFGSLCNG